MKSRLIPLLILAFLLSACTFSLAEDMTPPPNYIPPTPMPTLGPLYPAEAPDIENGAAIYAEKCAACHGPQGMGDGDQGKQLPVTVAGLGLPQLARASSPEKWFTVVTRGNLERFMPPFASLTDQERWEVVAYALTLHTTPEQIAYGQTVFESNCADCALDFFKDQTGMAALSVNDLVLLLKNGGDKVTALNGTLSDDDLYAAAAYLRTLTFAASSPTPEPATVTPTVAAAEATPSAAPVESVTPVTGDAGTPSAEGTPLATETTIPSTPEATGGKVTGSVSGEKVEGLTVTLRGFDHASDASGPVEAVTLTAVTNANGNFVFEGLEMPENRIYLAEVAYQGVTYSSELAIVQADASEMEIPPLRVYETTTDFSILVFDQAHFVVQIADGTSQVLGVYTFSNTSEQTIVIESPTEVPFIKFPADAQNIGFEVLQDSASFAVSDTGYAIPPSETPYGLLAFYNLPYDGKAQIVQPFVLPASSILVLVPDGVKIKSEQVVEGEIQNFQGTDYREYTGEAVNSGDTLTLNLSGNPKSGGTTSNSQQNLLIGVGAFGIVLILAGVWMYLRDRNRPDEETEEDEVEDEFDSEDEIVDAIIALDDLHRAGKLPDEAYQTRRAELKSRLKE